jgi:hypothetical protein
MTPDQWGEIKTIKENVIKQYQLALSNMKKSNYSLYASAKQFDAEYKKTLAAMDSEMADFKSRDGNYILRMSDTLLQLKLKQCMTTIANKFLVQIFPISSGRIELQMIEEELILKRDSELREIISFIENDGAIYQV